MKILFVDDDDQVVEVSCNTPWSASVNDMTQAIIERGGPDVTGNFVAQLETELGNISVKKVFQAFALIYARASSSTVILDEVLETECKISLPQNEG